MTSGLVLIVEDEPLLGRSMRVFLERSGYAAHRAPKRSRGPQLPHAAAGPRPRRPQSP